MKFFVFLSLTILCCCNGKVFVELNFDLTPEGEKDGLTAAHHLTEYLHDPTLIYLRFFHSLSSGNHGYSPQRTMVMEFQNLLDWINFEDVQRPHTHFLLDNFWCNWQKTVWIEDQETAVIRKKLNRSDQDIGGFVHSFRFSVEEGKTEEFDAWYKRTAEERARMTENEGYIARQVYSSGFYQSRFDIMINTEYTDFNFLRRAHLSNKPYKALLKEALPFLNRYSTTIYVPLQDNKGIYMRYPRPAPEEW
eukprot:TRINITY_DN19682_c0_g1_i1.p1 TRINITY_DN19682_c0_g1~~TRINITY_DN19682_c0_g1_i1.p1  ORF type:complete len:249 (+),score=23.79 TRINITY_DN19682_c0_g1_i1:51-797(+)